MLLYRTGKCPYCGEPQRIEIDTGEGVPQEFVWDCSVCCRPIQVSVAADGSGGGVRMGLRGEDEVWGGE